MKLNLALVPRLAALLGFYVLLYVVFMKEFMKEFTTNTQNSSSGVNEEVGLPRDKNLSVPKTADRLKVAYAITITREGPYLDGAAVLKQSIDRLTTAHDYEMIAIVHPGINATRPALQKLGFRIYEFELPIRSEDIVGEELRTTIDESGCCGAAELLKLCGYRLVEYDRVLLMDMDAVLMKSIDHLFDIEKEIVFTYDYNMREYKDVPAPVQGGFLLIRPSEEAYRSMMEIVRIGDFRPDTGWAGTRIGWCYGGQTVQGLISYYYNMIDPGNFFEADPCKYNAMASIKKCFNTSLTEIYSAHYTVCQKPWTCIPSYSGRSQCKGLTKFWWDVRREAEAQMGLNISTTNGCLDPKKYVPLVIAQPSPA